MIPRTSNIIGTTTASETATPRRPDLISKHTEADPSPLSTHPPTCQSSTSAGPAEKERGTDPPSAWEISSPLSRRLRLVVESGRPPVPPLLLRMNHQHTRH